MTGERRAHLLAPLPVVQHDSQRRLNRRGRSTATHFVGARQPQIRDRRTRCQLRECSSTASRTGGSPGVFGSTVWCYSWAYVMPPYGPKLTFHSPPFSLKYP